MSISKAIERDPSRFAADCVNDDDTEDVLSLCDMPLYGDADDCSFSSDDVSVSSSRNELFEFSLTYDRWGNDHPSPAPMCDSRDIIFCGKLIPYVERGSASNLRMNSRGDQTVKKNRKGVTKKVRARTISYTSARCDKWYMLAFGLARFPSEMAMSEIRRRQGKGNRGTIIVSAEGDGRTKGNEGGVWWMRKALRCSRREQGAGGAGAVVKASFGCIPRL